MTALARIRPAEAADAEAMVALAREVTSEEGGWLLASSAWRTVSEERRYVRTVQHHPDAALFVAELDGEIVGRLSLTRDPQPASKHVADLGLMVASSYRRRGIGSALMTAAEGWAARAGVSKLELHVFPHNAAAIALYEKCGYVREGLRRAHYAREDGTLLDAVLMAKRLS